MPSPTRKLKKGTSTPTPKMRKAVELTVENRLKGKGIKTQGMILKEAGYAPVVQRNPTQVTRSETFLSLLEKYLPSDLVAETQKELTRANELKTKDYPYNADADLNKIKAEVRQIRASIEQIEGAVWSRYSLVVLFGGIHVIRAHFLVPDHQARAKGLDQINKIRGLYAPIKTESKNLHFSLSDLRKLHEEQKTEVSQHPENA